MIANSLIAASCELLNLQTAILVLVVLGVLVLAKMVSDLRGEVSALRALRGQPSVPQDEKLVASPAPKPEPVPALVTEAPDEIPADVYAAIVAAVHYTLGQESHLVSVTPAESMMWSREGRRNIFNSHKFR